MTIEPTTEQRKAEYTEALQIWIGDMKLQRAMEREELAQLEGIERHLALSKGLLPNMIRVCRRHPRADTRLAVLAIVHLCSDNNEGLCRVGVMRMAELLGRKDENVRKALDDLEAGGEIGINRCRGLPNSYWPKIDASIARMSPSMGWFVDALSAKPAPRGRPATGKGTLGENVPRYRGGITAPQIMSPADGKNVPREARQYISKVDRYSQDRRPVEGGKGSYKGYGQTSPDRGGRS